MELLCHDGDYGGVEKHMSEHQILLPDEVYTHLLVVAQAEGLSPMEWIAAQLPNTKTSQVQPNPPQDISDLIGSIDSQEQPHQTYQQTVFGEALATKLARQGIQRP